MVIGQEHLFIVQYNTILSKMVQKYFEIMIN